MSETRYFASGVGVDADRQRLAIQEQAYDPTTIRHLELVGVAPGWKCLNVGAGYGSISVWLAERVGPTGKAVATDLRPDLHRRGDNRVELRQHDILRDDVEQNHYDLVCSRALLQHLSQPELAISRMAGAVRPGGWILLEEIYNWSIRSSDENTASAAVFDEYMRDAFEYFKRIGLLDPGLAPRVRSLVEQLGFQTVDNEGLLHVVRGGEPYARALEMSFRAGLDKLADVPSPDVMRLRAKFGEVARLLQDPSFSFIGDSLFSAWGRKPTG